MTFDFKDQTVIVTGGTRGIGRGIAEAFLSAGARVIVTYKSNQIAAEEFSHANREYVERLTITQFDITLDSEVIHFYRNIEQIFPSFDVLVNNSGIRRDSIVGMMKEEDWRAVLDTNCTGMFLVTKQAVQNMMRQRYGRIITITSPMGQFGFPGQANYAASKAAQVAFTKSLSKEVATRGITVNCVSPGFIDTDFIGDLSEKQLESYIDQIPLKRFGAPDEVAQAVLFLASKKSCYITGSVLEVTGGL